MNAAGAPPLFTATAEAPADGEAEWLFAADGTRLRAAFWPCKGRGVVMLFPGRTEMIEKYGRVVSALVTAGYAVSVIDWRGQGLSDRKCPDQLLGYVRNFNEFQIDLDTWSKAIESRYPPGLPRFVLAHSMGGCIALRALIRGLKAQAVAFSAPMWGLRLNRLLAGGMTTMARAARVTGHQMRPVPGAGIEFRLWENPFENNDLTSDPDSYSWMQGQLHAHPELRLGAPTLAWLGAALAETRALARFPSPAVPAWCGLGTREKLVSSAAIAARMERWPSGRLEHFEGAEHELMMERPHLRRRFLDAVCTHFAAHSGTGTPG